MPSNTRKSSTTEGLNLLVFSIPQGVLLQLGTGSVLVALLAGRAATKVIQSLSEASEEVFRGDRLPVLPFPVENETKSSQIPGFDD